MRTNAPAAFVLGLSTTGLSAVRSLGRRGIPVVGFASAAADPEAHSRYCAAKPCPDPIAAPQEFVDLLIREAKRFDTPPVLLPTADVFVAAVNEYRLPLGGWLRFNLPAPEAARNVLDKRRQFEIASALSIPVPRTAWPKDRAEAESIAAAFTYPAFIKPVYTYEWPRSFPEKGIEVHDAEEMRAGFARTFDAGVACLVQEIIPGRVENLESICLYALQGTGEIVGEFGMRKLRQCPPAFGVGTFVESMHNPELLQMARRFCAGCRYTGVAEIEFKRDARDGTYKLMELNARLWTQHDLAAACGVDFAWLSYADLAGLPVTPAVTYSPGIRWVDLLEDLYNCRHYRDHYGLGFCRWAASLKGARAFGRLAADDPWPFLAAAGRRALRKARGLR